MMRALLLALWALLVLLSASLPASAANRFWVGGTGDCSDTAHWASISGGAGGQSVPGAADTATWDNNSGGGTVTCTGPFTWRYLVCGQFAGTINFSGNFTLEGFADSQFTCTGNGVRTINLGNGTWIVDTTYTAPWSMNTITNLTWDAQGSTVILRGSSTANRTFNMGNLTYNNVTFEGNAQLGQMTIGGSFTANNLRIEGPNFWGSGASVTVTATTLEIVGTAAGVVGLKPWNSDSTNGVISVASGEPQITWAAIRTMTFQGGATFNATNSFDLGDTSGITISPPASGGGGIFGG